MKFKYNNATSSPQKPSQKSYTKIGHAKRVGRGLYTAGTMHLILNLHKLDIMTINYVSIEHKQISWEFNPREIKVLQCRGSGAKADDGTHGACFLWQRMPSPETDHRKVEKCGKKKRI